MRLIQISLILLLAAIMADHATAQEGVIKGTVVDEVSNEPIPFAKLYVKETETGTTSDVNGEYIIKNLEPGSYSIEASFVGYEPRVITDIEVTRAKPTILTIQLREQTSELQEVVIQASPFQRREESPISLRTLNASEIQRFPGGNRDVSNVIRSLPGVGAIPSFRNDIIIRGGAPNENRFYLDEIEIPNINHFATQGSSGGPVGLINVNLIDEVDFYGGAFPANRGNALSSIFSFTQKPGNPDDVEGMFVLGSSDIGLTIDTPINEKSSLIMSVRRSYLQFLFQALRLPFLPTYNDAQFKYNYNFSNNDKLTIIGLGAVDQFALNTSVNEGLEDEELIDRNNYILGNIPKQTQWNYTVGARYKHFRENSYLTIVASRSQLKNNSIKYEDNDDSSEDNLVLDYSSQEIENKLRIENTARKGNWKLNVGAGYELAQYTNETFNRIIIAGQPTTVDFESELFVQKYSAFGQASYTTINRRWLFSLGLRTDGNDYNNEMANPLNQLSPRFSVSYNINEKWSITGNVGRYFQLPAYTILGFRDSSDALVNQDRTTYIQSDHLVAGFAWLPTSTSRISVEGFYKLYSNYPFSLNDSISLANLGADFGVIGNEPVASTSEGRSYGVEFLAQQKLTKGFYGILAYTFVRSEFETKDGDYAPSSWDNRHIVSLTGGKRFGKGWEVGLRWLFSGGTPYTPIDIATSSLISSWQVTRQGIRDYDRLNEERLPAFHQLDVRVDKRWYFDKWSLNLYLDIQNLYGYVAETAPIFTVETDANDQPLVNPDDPSRYQYDILETSSGTVLPTVGIIVEF